MFIVAEGIEGTGKSTLLAALAQRLRGQRREVAVTREPGGTVLGDAVRELFLRRSTAAVPLAEALLVNAARAQHLAEVIRPALALGSVVLCDRFTDSTLAYQGYGRGLDLDALRSLCAIATDGLEPDLTLLLDAPVAIARERLQRRSAAADRIEREDDAFHERVRRGFLALAAAPRHCVLDATLSPERLLASALQLVEAAVP